MTTTLITGASSGIELELVKQFASDSENVVIRGWKNRFMVTDVGFLPCFATRKLVAKMQDA